MTKPVTAIVFGEGAQHKGVDLVFNPSGPVLSLSIEQALVLGEELQALSPVLKARPVEN